MTRSARLAIIGLVFLLCGGSALVQTRLERERQAAPPSALYAVVRKQLDAVRSADFASAYRQASAGFQERVNMDAFSDQARSEAPTTDRAQRLEFGAVRFDGRHAFVPVYLFMADGDVVPCVYSLVQEESGWKIDGSRVLQRWPAGRRLGGTRG